MAFTTAALNAAADAVAADITAISLHSADPSTTGANEIAGGSPAYARKTPTYGAATGGAADLSASLVFDVQGGDTVSHYGLWAGATFYGGFDVTDESFGGQGTYTLTSAEIQG